MKKCLKNWKMQLDHYRTSKSLKIDTTLMSENTKDQFLTYVYQNFTIYKIFMLTRFDFRFRDEIRRLLFRAVDNYFNYDSKYTYQSKRFPRLITHILFDIGLEHEKNELDIYFDMINVLLGHVAFRVNSVQSKYVYIIYLNQIIRINVGSMNYNELLMLNSDIKAMLIEDLIFLFYSLTKRTISNPQYNIKWIITEFQRGKEIPTQNEFINAMQSGNFERIEDLIKAISDVMSRTKLNYASAFIYLRVNQYDIDLAVFKYWQLMIKNRQTQIVQQESHSCYVEIK